MESSARLCPGISPPTHLQQSGSVTINYDYDPLYRLTSADYSTGDTYGYTYDSVGNRLTETTQLATTNYVYDNANRTTSAGGQTYTFDANGNLLNDGQNTFAYDSANRLISVSGQSTVSSYQYNGLGDRLSQNGVNYTLDLNTGLTQVLSDGTTSYTYGLGRISQTNNSTAEYFLGDALGSVRQLTNTAGEVIYAKSYDPYGVVTQVSGEGQSAWGYTGEQQDSYIKLIYLRSRMYSPVTGRFTSKDSWLGDYNRPLSLNRWNYVEGNPINKTDPSGNSPETTSQILSRALSQYSTSSSTANITGFTDDCLFDGDIYPQRDLTGYLAEAMTKHGQDNRVKAIAFSITAAEKILSPALFAAAYVGFYFLEATGKVWDIKRGIDNVLGTKSIVLCGAGKNCDWFDYSTPGNIHFGYIAGLAKIDHFIAAVAGGKLEQDDIKEELAKKGIPYDSLACFKGNILSPDKCDNPQDQAAVDFGYDLAKRYGSAGISDVQLRAELEMHGMGNFQRAPAGFPPPYYPYPQKNYFPADYFNIRN